ncbi:MAG TPA: Rrf2 family transcriptional regulator [Candidatus Polarisedimenticolaceae bacterium]|nr:Rrf2 family transcriptional regulator [Candidatus Polarisedimenticolaceae bacterium]
MKVSKRGEYGMRALCHLAERSGDGLLHIREIAREEQIPAKFLEGILLELKRAGFVLSRRGNEGGYALSRPAEQIYIGEVIRALDGPLAPMASAAELEAAMTREPRRAGFYALLMDVRDAVSAILDHTSLADVVRRNRQHAPAALSAAGEE